MMTSLAELRFVQVEVQHTTGSYGTSTSVLPSQFSSAPPTMSELPTSPDAAPNVNIYRRPTTVRSILAWP